LVTKLDKPLKREVALGAAHYVVTIDPQGLNFTVKGRRKGIRFNWADLVSGEAALAIALNASLSANIEPTKKGGPPRHA